MKQDYCDLKRSLAAKYKSDREAYTEAKKPFVDRVVSAVGGKDAAAT